MKKKKESKIPWKSKSNKVMPIYAYPNGIFFLSPPEKVRLL
jgi:hypothetical protein